MIQLADIRTNDHNPRFIRDERFAKLVKSIQEFPEMMALRPIVVDADNMVLGGNMRLRALQEAGYKEVPDEWIKQASELTEDQQRRFIIADNVGFGQWDWDLIGNEWDAEQVGEWGLDLPEWAGDEPDIDDLIGEDRGKPPTMKITFETAEQLQEAENDIQELIDRKFAGAYYSVSAGEI